MQKFILISLLFILPYNLLFSQEFPEKELKKKLKAKNIEFLTDGVIKVQSRKNKKWGIYQWDKYMEEPEEMIPFMFDSIGWFKDFEPVIIVKNEEKYGLLPNPYEIHEGYKKIKFEYEGIHLVKDGWDYYSVAKNDGKWGLIDWFDGFVLVNFMYDDPTKVPLIQLNDWQKSVTQPVLKKLKADLIEWDQINEDGVLKARNSDSKKWGMYQVFSKTEINELIPMKYDSLGFFDFNGEVAPVYNNGKVGFYLPKWSYGEEAKESVPCIYDDYKKYYEEIESEYGGTKDVFYLAVKRDGKWGWVDWFSGEEISEFIYATNDELPYPEE